MKRLLLTLLPWMVMVGTAAAQSRPAEVLFTHHGSIAERGIRVADECYVPLDFIKSVGWKYKLEDTHVVIDTPGKDARVPMRIFSTMQALPLRMALDQIGAESFWFADKDTLAVCSPVRSVEIRGGQIKFETSLPVKPRVFTLQDPPRLVVDLEGARVQHDSKIDVDNEVGRVQQFQSNVVRMVIELPEMPQPITSSEVGTRFSINAVSGSGDMNVERRDPITDPLPGAIERANSVKPAIQQTPPTPGMKFVPVGPLIVDIEGPSAVLLSLKVSGKLPAAAKFQRPEPNVLEIVLTGASMNVPDDFKLKSASITETTVRQEGNSLIIGLRLVRPMGVELSSSGNNLMIQLLKPNVGDGHLAGKIVVVDAGHGGHDGGAKSGSVREKDLALKISKYLSERLAKEGATVIMTRKTDVFIPLKERAEIANRNDADLFISVHINSTGKKNSTSGGMTFYHKNSPIGQLLADCIQREIAKVSKIKNLGAWSDGRIYDSGFAVLRHSTMPGVLIELGFINNDKDRARMVTEDFQKSVAGAIVRGLRIYLGDDQTKNQESDN